MNSLGQNGYAQSSSSRRTQNSQSTYSSTSQHYSTGNQNTVSTQTYLYTRPTQGEKIILVPEGSKVNIINKNTGDQNNWYVSFKGRKGYISTYAFKQNSGSTSYSQKRSINTTQNTNSTGRKETYTNIYSSSTLPVKKQTYLYTRPGTQGERIILVPEGSKVTVLNRNTSDQNNWYVSFNGSKGYISIYAFK